MYASINAETFTSQGSVAEDSSVIGKLMRIITILLLACQSLSALSFAEQFQQIGYTELCNTHHGAATFDALYASFDELTEFLQKNRSWAQKLYSAKERFIRSQEKDYYSTDFFGFYDESNKKGRNQISFYYAIHFHEFISAHYPELANIPEITRFLHACDEIQKVYGYIFEAAATELGIATLFSSRYNHPPILLKIVKYLPAYSPTRPHYDGSAFSLFLDSTDNQSLLLAPYASSSTAHDFSAPLRKFARDADRNSLILIPGALLTEFSLYPTPHIVIQSNKTRYATIAFAMRPHHTAPKIDLALLPSFSIE